jgi:glucose-6-phosphate 1-dehydrogenase
MDPPTNKNLEAIRDEKARLLRSIKPIAPEDVVRGQFKGYRDEPEVAKDSTVETFAAMRLRVDNWRWAGVPFYVRAGKNLPEARSEIVVALKPPPYSVFGENLAEHPNYLRFRLGPDVAIALGVLSKQPGETAGQEVELIATKFQGEKQDDYARLLGDAIRGDATLFAREDSIEAQWRIVEPILGNVTPLKQYEPGTWGPPEADELTRDVGGWEGPASK